MGTMDAMMDGIDWKEGSTPFEHEEGMPYATHEGIWHFMGQDIRVYRLNTGQTIIHADDMEKLLNI